MPDAEKIDHEVCLHNLITNSLILKSHITIVSFPNYMPPVVSFLNHGSVASFPNHGSLTSIPCNLPSHI